MEKKLSQFERELMLDEITFYSICPEEDRMKILGQKEMTFQDFRRLSLLTDYLELPCLHQFIWDLHGHKFMVEMEEVYQKCRNRSSEVPQMLMETAQWLEEFLKAAPNPTVAYLLEQIFANGLNPDN
ncbi:MAG TPA: hypothetical protein H9809_07920 [Candidatus Blautia pullicola]|uniref:Uncharacterized protein n=1 Tax=Candidatus Blautia pullicola TaxID=2838498 RepID=A0A9D2FR16_9FIRM|nr:hypothetical protein [Candidatus Blautia pullicola]